MLIHTKYHVKQLGGIKVILLLFWHTIVLGQTFVNQPSQQVEKPPALLKHYLKKDTQRVNYLNKLARFYLKSLPDTAYKYAQQARQLAQDLRFATGEAKSDHYLGKFFYSQSNFNQATKQYLAALKLYQHTGNLAGQAEIHNALGQVYYYLSRSTAALKEHEQALKFYQQLSDKRGEATSLGYIGHLYEKQKKHKKALTYQKTALGIYKDLDDKTGLSKIYANIGSIYEDWQGYDQAFRYFNKAYQVNQSLNNRLDMIVNLNDLGDTYRKKGGYKKALIYTQQAYKLARELHQKYQMRSALRDLSKTYVLLRDYQKAHSFLEQSYTLYTEIYDEESARQIARMQTLYETSQKEKQIAVLEKDQKIAIIYRYLFAIGVFMLLVISWVVFSRQRLKIKTNRGMIEQHKRMYETQQALVQTELQNAQLNEQKLKTELENKRLKEQNLQAELAAKSKELTSHALHIIQKNKMLEELKDKLREIKRRGKKDASKQVQQAINLINYSFSLDKDWEDFKQIFEKVHQNFLSQLQEQHADLTPAETRLCTLIKLNLNSKDIAAIMGISTDSLRIARYRLRKKLRLDKAVKLNNFVANIG